MPATPVRAPSHCRSRGRFPRASRGSRAPRRCCRAPRARGRWPDQHVGGAIARQLPAVPDHAAWFDEPAAGKDRPGAARQGGNSEHLVQRLARQQGRVEHCRPRQGRGSHRTAAQCRLPPALRCHGVRRAARSAAGACVPGARSERPIAEGAVLAGGLQSRQQPLAIDKAASGELPGEDPVLIAARDIFGDGQIVRLEA